MLHAVTNDGPCPHHFSRTGRLLDLIRRKPLCARIVPTAGDACLLDLDESHNGKGNIGTNSRDAGYQPHVINDMNWGKGNQIDGNVAEVSGQGFGFFTHIPEAFANTVLCSNEVSGAQFGFANVNCAEKAAEMARAA